MRTLATALRVVITGLLRLAFRLYFRSIRIEGLERFPRTGPVLLVANHPNSLIDPALLMTRLPRPVHFAAKHTLFQGPFKIVFEAFRAVPVVRAQDDRRAMARNARMFKRFEGLLRDGHVAAIFPEGLSQDEPHMAPAKTGAARIALDAEAEAGFTGRVRIVPVGLQFEPRRRFRGDAFIRIGQPFTVAEFKDLFAEDPRRAARELTEKISAAIKQLAYHVDDTARVPFIERLVDVYTRRARQTGIGAVRGRAVRGELKQKMAACLNHYTAADPEAVAAVEHDLKRYERLRAAAGLDRRPLEQPIALLPGPLAPFQAAVEAVVGLVPAAFGLLTSGVPYYLTTKLAARIVRRQDHRAGMSLVHILAGGVAYPLCYGLEVAWVWSQFSDQATLWFARLLVPLGLFAWAWTHRMRRLAVHVGGRVASWMKLDAVARVVRAQQDLVARMDEMRERFRAEVLGLPPSIPRRQQSWRKALVPMAGILALVAAAFVYGLRDRDVAGLPVEPSPWHLIRTGEAMVVADRLDRDARGLAAAIGELERLESQMRLIRAEFGRGARSYYSQADRDAIHRLLLTYLNLRTALLRTVWTYRGAHDRVEAGPFEDRAFLLAYASAAKLIEKAEVVVTTFADDREARRALNAGDAAWNIPEGTYDRLRASLASPAVAAELLAARARFDALPAASALSADPVWRVLLEAASGARPAIDRLIAGVAEESLQIAAADLSVHAAESAYLVERLVSTWIGDFRFKTRPTGRGLISAGQLDALSSELQPGDILLERRNWFLSNAFLPGYWPHAALYLGSPEALEALGVASDPRVARHWEAFSASDAAGHPYRIIEAVSEGVVFTSLEHSVGEADAVAVLRPRLTDEERREAIARAFSHYGKPYDFEFDFFSTDRLVCTEVVYRVYDGMVKLPLTPVLGRQVLPAIGFVQIYADTRQRSEGRLDFVRMLDDDEDRGVAVPATEEVFLQTLTRSGLTVVR